MNKMFYGNYPATILSYDPQARTAQVDIPSVTDGLEDGITATFAYPVGHDDKDTELLIVPGCECYVFFQQGKPENPVIAFYRSHGTGAVVDYRRIRQKNIELLATAKINLQATDSIELAAKSVTINADQLTINGNTQNNGNLGVSGSSSLEGATTIQGRSFLGHSHRGVSGGSESSGGVK